MNTYIIREATISDLTSIGHLFYQYQIFYKIKSNPAESLQFIQERFNRQESTIFVAIQHNEIIGFVQLYPLFSSTQMKRLWLLNDLFVAEKHRRKGVAKQLIDQIKIHSIATKAIGFYLETAKDNTAANYLYQATGLQLDQSHFYYFFNPPTAS